MNTQFPFIQLLQNQVKQLQEQVESHSRTILVMAQQLQHLEAQLQAAPDPTTIELRMLNRHIKNIINPQGKT